MNNPNIKILAVVAFAAIIFVLVIGGRQPGSSVSAGSDTAADYKAKCAMCHGPLAAKSFDPTTPMEKLVEMILNGNKSSKPPMPSYADKGINADQAKALAQYMVTLRKPPETNSNVSANTANLHANTADPAANTQTSGDCPKTDGVIVEQTVATYRTKCALCHSPWAEKSFDLAKSSDALAGIILKGNQASKPPMPGFEAKGVTPDDAKALVSYMRALRAQPK
jgi:mono/diheme cytochrome c family protein